MGRGISERGQEAPAPAEKGDYAFLRNFSSRLISVKCLAFCLSGGTIAHGAPSGNGLPAQRLLQERSLRGRHFNCEGEALPFLAHLAQGLAEDVDHSRGVEPRG